MLTKRGTPETIHQTAEGADIRQLLKQASMASGTPRCLVCGEPLVVTEATPTPGGSKNATCPKCGTTERLD